MRIWPLLAYAGLYGAALATLARRPGFRPAEPVLVLLILGIGFSALAWWSTRGIEPRPAPVRLPRREGATMLACLVPLTAFITWGLPAIRTHTPAGWPSELAVLGAKLAMFVAIPLWFWSRLFGYRAGDLLGLRQGLAGHWRPALVLGAGIVVFQAVLGRARAELPGVTPDGVTVLAFGAGFAWLLLDVGAVEEVPFRVLLQHRLAAWGRSDFLALVGMALIFGLAHAPGLYLRPELTGEGLGADPSLPQAVAYSVAYTSAAGLYLGVLWLRTRNLWVVAVVHAAQDWLPTVLDGLKDGYFGA